MLESDLQRLASLNAYGHFSQTLYEGPSDQEHGDLDVIDIVQRVVVLGDPFSRTLRPGVNDAPWQSRQLFANAEPFIPRSALASSTLDREHMEASTPWITDPLPRNHQRLENGESFVPSAILALAPSVLSVVPSGSSVVPSGSSVVPSALSVVPSASSVVPSALSVVPSASSVLPSASSVVPSASSVSSTLELETPVTTVFGSSSQLDVWASCSSGSLGSLSSRSSYMSTASSFSLKKDAAAAMTDQKNSKRAKQNARARARAKAQRQSRKGLQ